MRWHVFLCQIELKQQNGINCGLGPPLGCLRVQDLEIPRFLLRFEDFKIWQDFKF